MEERRLLAGVEEGHFEGRETSLSGIGEGDPLAGRCWSQTSTRLDPSTGGVAFFARSHVTRRGRAYLALFCVAG